MRCNNAETLLKTFIEKREWHLFIDSSKPILAACCSIKWNEYLQLQQDTDFMWRNRTTICTLLRIVFRMIHIICISLNVLTLLVLHLGYMKYSCFLKVRGERRKIVTNWKKKIHFHKHWPQDKNVISQPLINPQKSLLLLLNIKLAVMNISIKTMDQNGNGFLYLKQRFPEDRRYRNQKRDIAYQSRERKQRVRRNFIWGSRSFNAMTTYSYVCEIRAKIIKS